MKKVTSRIAVVIGAVALSVGMIGAAAPANAAGAGSSVKGGATTSLDSSWGR